MEIDRVIHRFYKSVPDRRVMRRCHTLIAGYIVPLEVLGYLTPYRRLLLRSRLPTKLCQSRLAEREEQPQVMTMKTTTLTPEQLSKYGLDNVNCEFYRNITRQGIDSLFEKTNFLDGEEDDNGVITMYCCRVTHVFVPIKRGKYEWWKCYQEVLYVITLMSYYEGPARPPSTFLPTKLARVRPYEREVQTMNNGLKCGVIRTYNDTQYYQVHGCSYRAYCAKAVSGKAVARCEYAEFIMNSEVADFEVICNDD